MGGQDEGKFLVLFNIFNMCAEHVLNSAKQVMIFFKKPDRFWKPVRFIPPLFSTTCSVAHYNDIGHKNSQSFLFLPPPYQGRGQGVVKKGEYDSIA